MHAHEAEKCGIGNQGWRVFNNGFRTGRIL